MMTNLFKKQTFAIKKGKKGFTLIELIIVIAVIAILVTALSVVLAGQVANARRQADQANANMIRANAETLLIIAVGSNGNENIEISGNTAIITAAGLERLAAMSDGTTDIDEVLFGKTTAGIACTSVTYKGIVYTFGGDVVTNSEG